MERLSKADTENELNESFFGVLKQLIGEFSKKEAWHNAVQCLDLLLHLGAVPEEKAFYLLADKIRQQSKTPHSALEQRKLLEAGYQDDVVEYQRLNKRSTFCFSRETMRPILTDKMEAAGTVSSYLWQDLWAAKHIFERQPKIHYDIGSRVDGFITHLLSFSQKVCLLDVRPLPYTLPGLDFTQCDATNLDDIEDNSIESLSALCSLEHFGLGRHGDPIDPEACFKCFEAIQRKMKSGGVVYISVPIGQEHVEYNAHRVFYAQTIVDHFPEMRLLEFATALNEKIEYGVDIHCYDSEMTRGQRFGLFLLEKK